jgi:hypothetical protein
MTTPLRTTLKRTLTIDGREFVVTLNPVGLKVTLKGKRNGVELAWKELVNGDAALAVALQASIGGFDDPKKTQARVRKSARSNPRVKPRSSRRAERA